MEHENVVTVVTEDGPGLGKMESATGIDYLSPVLRGKYSNTGELALFTLGEAIRAASHPPGA